MQVEVIFSIIVLIMSVVIHEVSHGAVAGLLGDPTARLAGRLTLNPIKHLDPVGSVILPFILSLIPGGVVFGWAKPVPYNPYNLRGGQWGPGIVAAAGPASNLLLAIIFSVVLRLGAGTFISPLAVQFVAGIVFINLILMFFNLVPVPPLDGSKILFSLLPYRFRWIENSLNQFSLPLIILVIFGIGGVIYPLTLLLFRLLTGLGL
jgi:Zn-dependent protease